MDTMIELPAMRRSAELAPNTADADSRTVEVVWSAGARASAARPSSASPMTRSSASTPPMCGSTG